MFENVYSSSPEYICNISNYHAIQNHVLTVLALSCLDSKNIYLATLIVSCILANILIHYIYTLWQFVHVKILLQLKKQ